MSSKELPHATKKDKLRAWLKVHPELWAGIPAVTLELLNNEQRVQLQTLLVALRRERAIAPQATDPITQVLNGIRYCRDDRPPLKAILPMKRAPDTVQSLQADADRLMPHGPSLGVCAHCGEPKTAHRVVDGGIWVCPRSIFVARDEHGT